MTDIWNKGRWLHNSATLRPPANKMTLLKQQGDPLGNYGDGKSEQGKNHEGNAGLGKYSGEVGNRQGLPEQDAAITTFSVQRLETVEDGDNKCRRMIRSAAKV